MIRDDYAGPGGWSEGLALLGLSDVGIEWDRWACATRAAAGHATIRADLATYRPGTPAGGWWGYLASPPCQTFSAAGSGAGRAVLPELVAAVDGEDWSAIDRHDDRTRHVLIAARSALTLGAEWVALEQVPAVLPVWEAVARRLRSRCYQAWTGVLVAADYGVPQARRRAILIASRTRAVTAPEPTHAAAPTDTLFGPALQRWVSMADALGWGIGEEPAATVTAGGTGSGGGVEVFGSADYRQRLKRLAVDRRTNSSGPKGTVVPTALVPVDRPAPTLTSNTHLWRLRPGLTESQPNRRTYGMGEPAPTIAMGHVAAGWCWERPATAACADPRLAAPWPPRPRRRRTAVRPRLGAAHRPGGAAAPVVPRRPPGAGVDDRAVPAGRQRRAAAARRPRDCRSDRAHRPAPPPPRSRVVTVPLPDTSTPTPKETP